MRAPLVVTMAILTGALAVLSGQTFEVASVKPNPEAANRISIRGGAGRFTATAPVRELIRFAYGVQDFQIVDGPDWIVSDRFDVNATAPADLPPDQPGAPTGTQMMMRALLADRFKLMTHSDTRELPMYALVLARGDRRLGPGLKPAAVDCAARATGRRGAPPPVAPGERPPCGMRRGPGSFTGGGTTMTQLAQTLSATMGRIVADKTGLAGGFDLDLAFTPDQLPAGAPPPGVPAPPFDPNGPSLVTALQEQLGLKLEATRGPVPVLVIDSVERPTPD